MKGRHLKVAETELAEPRSAIGIEGLVVVELFGPDGELKEYREVRNLITDVGDQYYMERAAGIGSPPNQVTGMRLGTSTTAAAKSGAGSFNGAHITGSSVAITGGYPQSSKPAAARRIQWKSSWAAGVATNAAIGEVALTNENPLTDVVGVAANTVARAVLSPTQAKGALDTLDITWSHDGLGA